MERLKRYKVGKFCNKNCLPVCDFCIYFDWWDIEERKEGNYEGTCKKHNQSKDAGSHCEDFICINVGIDQLSKPEQKVKKEYKRL